jgi:hypothetical protein
MDAKQGWEYKIDRHSIGVSHESAESPMSLERIQECLNDEGSDGWEVVSIMETDTQDNALDFIVVYKRPAELRPPGRAVSPDEMKDLQEEAKRLRQRSEP